MASRAELYARVARALWSSGLLRLPPRQFVGVAGAFWRCGRSFAALAAVAAVRHPNRLALLDDEGALTFAELASRADALAAALAADEGLREGTRAAVLCRNGRGFVVALLALSRLGADVLILNTESPAPALRDLLARESADVVLHDDEFEALLSECLPRSRMRGIDQPSIRTPTARLPRVRRAGRLAVLTAGSTGAAKAVRRAPTFGSLLPALAGLLEGLPAATHQPIVLAIPLCHGYGIATLAIALALGAPLHMAHRPEIEPLVAGLPDDPPAVLVTVPTLLQRWLRQIEGARAPRLAAIVSGSAPLDGRLCTQLLEAFGPVLFNLYGSTEAGLIAMARPADLLDAPGGVGRPLPGTEVQLRDPDGRPICPPGVGRICVRGPLVLLADSDGWYDTGDLGRWDAEGRLFVCGRSDSMLVCGGENVYPCETEAALAAHPAVLEVAVAPVQDAEFGQRMEAWVVPAFGGQLNETLLLQWLRGRIERYKLPRRIHFVSGIPRNALGKVERPVLLGEGRGAASSGTRPR